MKNQKFEKEVFLLGIIFIAMGVTSYIVQIHDAIRKYNYEKRVFHFCESTMSSNVPRLELKQKPTAAAYCNLVLD